ncbi:MAG: glutathione S-transferase family protein, partial [Acetobacteraceae bacterium]
MAIQLFELCGADPARRFSPYCWRSRLALAHKGLAVETIPWRFTEKAAIGAHGAQKVPVMLDNGRAIIDSWAIAEYLEGTYPDRPSLFGGAGGHALARFINAWGDAVLHAGIARLVVSDIVQHLTPEDAAYFVPDREKRFGLKLSEVTADRGARFTGVRVRLVPLRFAVR